MRGPEPIKPTRRALLAASLALPAAPRLLNAQGLRRVSMTLSWLADGYSAYVYAALPYWRERGLDVTVSRGHGSVTAAQAIASGQFQFGLSNATVAMQLAAKDLWLRALAMVSYETSMGVAVLADSPIRAPADLVGKRVALAVTSSDAAFFKPFCLLNNVPYDQVQVLTMDPQVRDRALGTGQVDAIGGFASSFVAAFGAQGRPIRLLLYSRYGLPIYGDATLFTTPATAEAESDLCAAMADGLMQGLKATLLRPAEGQAAFLAANPAMGLTDTGPEFVRLGMAVQRYNVMAVPDAKNHGLGWTDTARLAQTAELVLRYQADPGTKVPDMARIFTNAHAGRITLSDAEWATAEANTAFIKPFLGA